MLTMRFKLKVSTPYCYVRAVRQLLPLDCDALFQELELLIQYCAMLPELVGRSSGEIFFAGLLHLCKMYGILQIRGIVLALAARWPNIEQITEQLGARL